MTAIPHTGVIPLHSQKLMDLDCELKEHDEFINGNGKPGAKERLSMLEDHYSAIERKLNWLMIICGSVLGGTVTWFLTQQLPKIAALK